jgi:serine protease Do
MSADSRPLARPAAILGRWHRLIAAAMLVLAAAFAPEARADASADGFAALLKPLWPAVVTIQTTATTPHGRMFFDGSGFILDPSGLIVTNRHVIAGAYYIKVTIPGLGPFEAKPLYVSSTIDLALLKVEAGQPLPALTLGDSTTVKVGDEVLLLGNPLGVGLSLSHGVISALDRDISDGLYDHFFQTDGALNHGNSGGPMVNMRGEVIAVDTALISSPGNTGSVGLGFALPINDAKFFIDQYLHDRHVVAGNTGIQAQRVTDDLAVAFGLDRARGLIVTAVAPGASAEGLVDVGDIILQVNGRDASDARDLGRIVETTPPGMSLQFVLRRHGLEQSVSVPVRDAPSDPSFAAKFLGHAPPGASRFATPSDPGMTLGDLSPAERQSLDLTTGVAVTAVTPNGPAANKDISAGDAILVVGATPVSAPAEVTRELQSLAARHAEFAAMLVRSPRRLRWIALPLETDR